MSDTIYSYHDDEGYAEDSIYQPDNTTTQLTPNDKELYFSEYTTGHEPRFTEEEMCTVIQGTRAEFRILLKDNKKRYNMDLQRLQHNLQQILQEEKMIADNSIAERESALAMAREETDIGYTPEENSISSSQEYDIICSQVGDMRKQIESIRMYKELTDDGMMEIKQQIDELDFSLGRVRDKRSSVIEDFIETDLTYKKTVRKCREAKGTLISSVEQVDKLCKQTERKQSKGKEAEMKFSEYLNMVREEMQQKNKQYEDITKNCKQELLIMNTQLKRGKMELQELDSQIAKADQKNKELTTIGDELMAAMQ